jgi:hypothetical protein
VLAYAYTRRSTATSTLNEGDPVAFLRKNYGSRHLPRTTPEVHAVQLARGAFQRHLHRGSGPIEELAVFPPQYPWSKRGCTRLPLPAAPRAFAAVLERRWFGSHHGPLFSATAAVADTCHSGSSNAPRQDGAHDRHDLIVKLTPVLEF